MAAIEHLESFLREVVRDEMRAVLQEKASQGETSGDEMLTVAAAAQAGHVHPSTVRGWIRGNQLRAHGRHKMTRVKRSDLMALLERGPAPKASRAGALSPEAVARSIIGAG